MEATVIRVSEARELLAFIPYQFGFVPQESLVAVSIRDPNDTLGLALRVDLSDLSDGERGADLTQWLREHMEADGARRVVLVVYTEAHADLGNAVGVAGRALRTVLDVFPPDLPTEEWWVSPTGYGAVGCTDLSCCPEAGRPLSDLESTQVGAHMVVAGVCLVPDRESLEVRSRAVGPARRSALRAAADERARYHAAKRAGEAALTVWSGRAHEHWSTLCRRAAEGRDLPAATVGRALVALEVPILRDEMLAAFGFGPAIGCPDIDVVTGAEAVFGPGSVPPDRSALGPIRAVLEAVVAHAPVRRGVPALASLACLAWWEGDATRAAVLVEQCLRLDEKYSLAQLLADALHRGLPPAWIRARRRTNRALRKGGVVDDGWSAASTGPVL